MKKKFLTKKYTECTEKQKIRKQNNSGESLLEADIQRCSGKPLFGKFRKILNYIWVSKLQVNPLSRTGTYRVKLQLEGLITMICFCGMVDRRKTFTPYFLPGPLSDIITIANLWHVASRVRTCAESEFRLCWMKLCSTDNHDFSTRFNFYMFNLQIH